MGVEIPRNMPADDLEAAIEKAQADLANACLALPPKTDPMLMASPSAVLDVFARSIRRFEKAVSDIIAARSPITDNDKTTITHAIEDGAYAAMQEETRMLTLFRRARDGEAQEGKSAAVREWLGEMDAEFSEIQKTTGSG